MANLETIATSPRADVYHVVIESPRGSAIELKYAPALESFTVSRPLPLGLSYPFDWGFIPSTHGPDGDPVDALALWDTTSYPGTVIECRLVGVIALEQKAEKGGRERNDRCLAVPVSARRIKIEDARRLAARVREELSQFLVAATALEGKEPKILGFEGPAEARALVRSSTRRRRAA
jgi:inorganic pyrophosphatase